MASHYRDAAKCLKAVDGGRTTLKTAAYKTQNPPRTVALVSEVRRHRKALETAIAATGLREKAGGDAQLLLVAVYDAVPAEDRDRTGPRTTRASRESVCERIAGPDARENRRRRRPVLRAGAPTTDYGLTNSHVNIYNSYTMNSSKTTAPAAASPPPCPRPPSFSTRPSSYR